MKKRFPFHRPLAILTLIVAIGLALTCWSGKLAWWPNQMAAKALIERNNDDAEDWVRMALAIDPESGEAEFLLARTLRKQGKVDQVAGHLKRAFELGYDKSRIVRENLLTLAQTGQMDGILVKLDNLLIDPRGDGREICEAYVNGSFIVENFNEGYALIAAWKKGFPDDPQPHYAMGRALEHLGHAKDAESEYRASLSKRSDHYPAAYALGRLLLERNRTQEAIEYFKICQSMRFNMAAQIGTAKCLRTLGQTDEARRILEKIVETPNKTLRKSFQRVGEVSEGLPAHFELGSLESAAGNYDVALKWLRLAVDAAPWDLSARYALGIALRGTGRIEEANREILYVSDARKALREVDRLVDAIDPDTKQIEERFRIGELYMRYESKRTAERWLKSALEHDPTHRPSHQLLADYYEEKAKEDSSYRSPAEHHRQLAEMPKLDSTPKQTGETGIR